MFIGSNEWLTPTERRDKIIKYICKKRNTTMVSLAKVFGVSISTIRRDIEYLSLSYPLESVRGRYDGGVRIHDEFYLNKKYLTTEQIDFLENLKGNMPTRNVLVIDSILNDFALCR